MALAVAQSVHFTGFTSTPSTTSAFAGATTVGNLIIVCVNAYNGTPGTGAITDSKGNTYTRDFQFTDGLLSQSYYSAPVTTGGTAHTITCGAGMAVVNMDAIEVSGQATSSPFDKSASNSGTGAPPWTSGSTGTLAQADEIVMVSVGVDTGSDAQITEDATYTLIGEFVNGSAGYVSNTAYKIVAATTAIDHTWTSTFGANPWFATAATYKAVAGTPTLTVASGAHAHTADNLALTIPGVFTVQDAAHAHTADQVPFPPQAIPNNASHAHTADAVILPSGSLVSDDFNRANGALGSAWVYGGTNFTIVSNHAHCVNADFAVYNTALPGPDHYVEADILTGDGTYTVIHGRTTPALRGNTCYEAFMVPTGGTPGSTRTFTIGKTVGGGYSDVASASASVANLTNFNLRLEMQGTALRLYLNSVLVVSTTDTSITTGNYAGINAQSNGDFDNWAAGEVGIPPVSLTVANAAHAHTADAPTLTTGFLVNSASHAHTAGNLLLPATLTVDSAAHAHTATTISIARFLYPVSVSNRKLIDQTGGVYILNDFSSWAMASMLTNAEITQALEGVAARHFNAVNVGPFIDNGGAGNGWRKLTNAAGQPFFATTAGGTTAGVPVRDPLGAAWSSIDWIVSECTRLGLTLIFSYFGGYNTANGITGEANACTVAEVYTYGQRVWNRYASNPNIVWHLEWEGMWHPTGSPEGLRADAFFHAIQDGHAASGRGGTPLIFAEQISNDTNAGAFVGTGWSWMLVSTTSLYMYTSNSTEVVDNAYNQVGLTTYPLWDCEPSYIGATQYVGGAGSYAPLTDQVSRQNWRERNYAILIRGGCGINFGDEKWWTFGAGGLYPSAPWSWQDVPTNVTSYEAQYCWDLLINPQIVQDPLWVPDNSFLVTGLGSGDTKAAAGRGAHTAVVYFPNNSRTVAVDTTKVGGTATSYLDIPTSFATTSDQAVLDDFTIVAKVRKPAFGVTQTIAGQGLTTTTGLSWRFGINGGGALVFDYSTSGTSFGGFYGTISSSAFASVPTGSPLYLAFNLQHDTSSQTYGGWWSADGVTWNGPAGGGTTGSAGPAFFNSTAQVQIGRYTTSGSTDAWSDRIYWVEMRNGQTPTTGTVAWRFDAAEWTSGSGWVGADGNTWTLSSGGAGITDVAATPVRLRWYDPVLATFTNIAVGEAPTTSRSVSFPGGTHSDNNTDWVLVIDDRTDLGVNNGNHAHTADNVALTVVFAVNNALHSHVADNITLSTGLVVANGLHAHTADNVSVGGGLAIANSAHAHTADNIVLGVGLLVADALHGHRADNVDVAPAGVVNNAFHAHIASNIVLTVIAISKIRLGAVTPQTMKVGTAPVTRVYLGNNQVF